MYRSWLTEMEQSTPVVQIKGRVRHETPEEGRRTYEPKRYGYNNKDEVNSPNILSNNKYKLFTSIVS